MKNRKSSATTLEKKPLREHQPDTLLKKLAACEVGVPKRNELLGYLGKYTHLADVIPEICARARREFGPQAELSLELYCDPEIKDRYLTLYVRQENYAPDIMDRIEEVSRRFEKRLEKTPGSFLITTDFCPPRGNHGV